MNSLFIDVFLSFFPWQIRGLMNVFYAPNFEEVEGAYWFGSVRAVSQSVCQSVCLSVSQSVSQSVMREHSVRNR